MTTRSLRPRSRPHPPRPQTGFAAAGTPPSAGRTFFWGGAGRAVVARGETQGRRAVRSRRQQRTAATAIGPRAVGALGSANYDHLIDARTGANCVHLARTGCAVHIAGVAGY